jgi:hypothetical protein
MRDSHVPDTVAGPRRFFTGFRVPRSQINCEAKLFAAFGSRKRHPCNPYAHALLLSTEQQLPLPLPLPTPPLPSPHFPNYLPSRREIAEVSCDFNLARA